MPQPLRLHCRPLALPASAPPRVTPCPARSEMAEVKEFMASKRIPSELQRKVRVHLGNLFNHRRAFDESQLLRHLPPQLMFEMLHEVYIESVWQVPVFKGLDEEIMAEICFILLPVSRPQGTVLFDVGDVARETYVVMEGSVQLSNVGAHAIHHGHDLSNQTPLDTVKAGDWVWVRSVATLYALSLPLSLSCLCSCSCEWGLRSAYCRCCSLCSGSGRSPWVGHHAGCWRVVPSARCSSNYTVRRLPRR